MSEELLKYIQDKIREACSGLITSPAMSDEEAAEATLRIIMEQFIDDDDYWLNPAVYPLPIRLLHAMLYTDGFDLDLNDGTLRPCSDSPDVTREVVLHIELGSVEIQEHSLVYSFRMPSPLRYIEFGLHLEEAP